MKHLLDYGTETDDTLLEELADEARAYLALIERLRDLPEGDERDTAQGELYASISHLKSHSEATLERLDDLVDALPEDEEAAHV